MADFRKWLFAFAVVALVLATGTSAFAQTTPFVCNANAPVPPQVRSEGITELVGDLILTCTGGTSTLIHQPIPLYNITVSLNTNITSRLFGSSPVLSEALLMVDEPQPGQQLGCQATGGSHCDFNSPAGLGTGLGTAGVNSEYVGQNNVFQAIPANTSANSALSNASVQWLGVPIDAPGTGGQRVIRITNIRANASALGVSNSFTPSSITEFISVNGAQALNINQQNVTVGFVVPGLTSSITPEVDNQCQEPNNTFAVNFFEGFASAWKVVDTNTLNGPGGTFLSQNIPGGTYSTESGFYALGGIPNITATVGLADFGTRLLTRLTGVQNNVTLKVPGSVLTSAGAEFVYVSTDANGDSTPDTAVPTPGGTVTLTVTSGNAVFAYEAVTAAVNTIESLSIPVGVSYDDTLGSNGPALGTDFAQASYGPLSNVTVASVTAHIPRFIDDSAKGKGLVINPCTCNLLFPFVTNTAGFDTGIALANTTLDPFGTAAQTGPVVLNYYGTSAPAAPITSQTIPAGAELIFTLSSGGNYGVPATPGFSGYIIAQAQFQYCHAFAFISDVGAQKLAEGYLAIQLDEPGLNRTAQNGENEGH